MLEEITAANLCETHGPERAFLPTIPEVPRQTIDTNMLTMAWAFFAPSEATLTRAIANDAVMTNASQKGLDQH